MDSDAILYDFWRNGSNPWLHPASAFPPPEGCSTNQQPGSAYVSPSRCPDPSGGHSYGINTIGGQSIVYQVPALPQPAFPAPYHPGLFTPRPSFSSRSHQQWPTDTIPLPQAVDHYSQVSTVINDHPTHEFWRIEYGNMCPVFPRQLDTQAVSGSVVDSVPYIQLPHVLQDMALGPESEQPVRDWPCPICPSSFRRWQDQERHILLHLPYWIYCPNPGCSWRGDRPDVFKKHWGADHPSSSQEPDKNGFTIYDPEPLIEGILEGSIPIEEAQSRAVLEVRRRTQELDKLELWDNCWGRKERKAGRFKRPRKKIRALLARGVDHRYIEGN